MESNLPPTDSNGFIMRRKNNLINQLKSRVWRDFLSRFKQQQTIFQGTFLFFNPLIRDEPCLATITLIGNYIRHFGSVFHDLKDFEDNQTSK